MATDFKISFATQELANLYLGFGRTDLADFRTGGDATLDDEIGKLDKRIATFQSAITDVPANDLAVSGSEEYPYDKTFLKREFMNEVLSLLLQRGHGVTFANAFIDTKTKGTLGVVTTGGLISGPIYAADPVVPATNPVTYKQGAMIWPGITNFDELTPAQVKSALDPSGDAIYDSYSTWIDAVFVEGNKRANNPIDPSTGSTINTKAVETVPERTINGVTYDRVTSEYVLDANGKRTKDADGADVVKYYLIQKGANMFEAQKTSVNSFVADASARTVSGGTPIDSSVTPTPGLSQLDSRLYLPVDKDLTPLSGVATPGAMRTLSPMWYLYYWNEARVKILRGQLNYLDAVGDEIRDDLAKANVAYQDLETQVGKTHTNSEDGKTPNPDSSLETAAMDFFEATNGVNAKAFWDTDASTVVEVKDAMGNITTPAGTDPVGGDYHNYAQWQKNRSVVKTYIDRKSTDAQRATQDYQGLLNKFNGAYEVMSKLQEKLDSLVKGQLRNIS